MKISGPAPVPQRRIFPRNLSFCNWSLFGNTHKSNKQWTAHKTPCHPEQREGPWSCRHDESNSYEQNQGSSLRLMTALEAIEISLKQLLLCRLPLIQELEKRFRCE